MDSIAILLPCLNEELTIAKVIDDCRAALPQAVIYVFDNNSSDRSAAIALAHGARVIASPVPGKGAVVRQMFQEIEADIYLMVDADDTYEVASLPLLVEAVLNGADMVVGDRLSSTYYSQNKRRFHNSGNRLVKNLVNYYFCGQVDDIMTGYRAFSRNFVKTIKLESQGFTIETEMTIAALLGEYKIVDLPIEYRDRPQGSVSKLATFTDGFKVLRLIFRKAFWDSPARFFLPIATLTFTAMLILLVLQFARIAPSFGMLISFLVLAAVNAAILLAVLLLSKRHNRRNERSSRLDVDR